MVCLVDRTCARWCVFSVFVWQACMVVHMCICGKFTCILACACGAIPSGFDPKFGASTHTARLDVAQLELRPQILCLGLRPLPAGQEDDAPKWYELLSGFGPNWSRLGWVFLWFFLVVFLWFFLGVFLWFDDFKRLFVLRLTSIKTRQVQSNPSPLSLYLVCILALNSMSQATPRCPSSPMP